METRVLLEEVRSDVRRLAEGHTFLVSKLEEDDKRFDPLEIVVLETSARVSKVESSVSGMVVDIRRLEGKVSGLDDKFTSIISDHEVRIKHLEKAS